MVCDKSLLIEVVVLLAFVDCLRGSAACGKHLSFLSLKEVASWLLHVVFCDLGSVWSPFACGHGGQCNADRRHGAGLAPTVPHFHGGQGARTGLQHPRCIPGIRAGAPNYAAWCAASTAADIMGYWHDVKGKAGIADGMLYAKRRGHNRLGSARPDRLARRFGRCLPGSHQGRRPHPRQKRPRLVNDTNDQGDVGMPGSGGAGGSETFAGTKCAALQPGLKNYLTAAGYPAATVTYKAFPAVPAAADWSADWSTIVTEVNAGRPLMGLFSHGQIFDPAANPTPNYDLWEWVTAPATNPSDWLGLECKWHWPCDDHCGLPSPRPGHQQHAERLHHR